jgi:hypothetical protein
VTLTSEELAKMDIAETKAFAKEIGLDIDDCQTLGQARTKLLRSALEFKNIK